MGTTRIGLHLIRLLVVDAEGVRRVAALTVSVVEDAAISGRVEFAAFAIVTGGLGARRASRAWQVGVGRLIWVDGGNGECGRVGVDGGDHCF